MGEVTLVPPAPVPTAPPKTGGRPWTGRVWRVCARFYWAWPALLTLVLGLWRARRPALWADELATWGAVRLSWGQLWQLLGHIDATVGPYYLGLKLWTEVAGTGNLALRLPSIVAMAVAAGLVAVLGAELADTARRRAGTLAGALFAIVPATSRYAQEARPYAFTILFACLATLALRRLLARPGPLRATGYALCIVALGAAHLLAVLLLAGHAVAVVQARRRPAVVAWAVGATAALVALLPLAILGAHQRSQISWIPEVTWRSLLSVPDTIFVAAVVGGAVVALAVLAVDRRPAAVLLTAWALVPPLALFLIAQVQSVFWARYLLFTLPAWVLLAARTLGRLSLRRAATVLAVVAALGFASQLGIRVPAGHSHATSAAGAIIAANERPGDGLVVALHESPEPWEARDIVARYVPADRRPVDVFAVTPQRTDGQLLATECADLARCLDAVDPARIWVIRFETQTDPLANLGQPKEELLRARYHTQQLWLVRGLTVALLVRN